ncbi:MAG: oxidoreductase [Pirellulaceae bacterium]|nr:oxidoreductase [Pirellulaceae bacterium]
MPELHAPWLELAVALPLLAAMLIQRISAVRLRWLISSVVAGLVLLVAIVDWLDFASLRTFEAHDPHSLTQSLFGRELVIVDELNAPLLTLSAALYFAIILLTPIPKRERFPFGLTLVSLTLTEALLSSRAPLAVIGLLAAQNLLPLIELRQRQQAWKFFAIHQALSLGLMIGGWLCIDTNQLATTSSVTGVVLMAIGLLIRCGCIPTHCWMIDLFDRASLGTALLFVTPMAGAYALMRLVLPIAPVTVLQGISFASLITAIYASGMVLVQTSTRRFYCYLLLSNSSLLLVGLESLTPTGLTGSLSMWLAIGIALISLGIVIRALEGRIGRVDILRFHGLYSQMPLMAVLFLLALLASIGFPGTVGFVGLELLVESALESSSFYAVVVVVTTALNGIGALRVYFRLFTGTNAPATVSLQPLPLERLVIYAFAGLIVVGGIFPQPGVTTRYHAAGELMKRRGTFFDLDSPATALPVVPKIHEEKYEHSP